ncbi:glycosyltransferase family 2 protein [Candidatus Sumerlaeota bacterium]|nr:glycosyltransferase family 2 protein [Candidatus Sumerlaeota bacterium]
MSHPEFSVIITCYFEEKSIDEFYGRLSKSLEGLNRTYEIIFVNDGSTDGTWDRLQDIYKNDEHVTAILDFTRNFGQNRAMTAGFCEASGDAYIIMDSDLQLSPEELPNFIAEYDKGADVVVGYREERKDSLYRTLPSRIANVIMRRLSESDFRDFGCTYKLFRSAIVKGFGIGPFRPWTTVRAIAFSNRRVQIPVSHRQRKYGKSGYTFKKLFTYNMDNMVRCSQRPFQVLGGVFLAFALLLILRVLFMNFTPFSILRHVGNGLLLNVIMGCALVILGLLCVLGEYIIRIFTRSFQEPAYIIRTAYRKH